MHTHQVSSKNLTTGEKMALTMKLKEEIALENEKKKIEAGKSFYGNQHVDCTPIGVDTDVTKSHSDTWTDAQIAKKAGVGVGTVARYNRVMNSDDEAKQRKVAVEYVKLCGYRNGGDRQAQCQVGTLLSLDQIAEQLGTSKRNLARALSIERNLIHRLYAVSHKYTINRKKHIQKAIGAYQDNFGGF